MQGNWETDEALLADFKRDLKAKEEGAIVGMISTRFSITQCWIIVGQIQLALQYPQNVGPAADEARSIAEQMINVIATTPAEKEIADRGWTRGPQVFQ